MLVVDLHRLVESLFCVGGDLQSSIEELLRGLAVDAIPDVLLGEVVLRKYLLRQ